MQNRYPERRPARPARDYVTGPVTRWIRIGSIIMTVLVSCLLLARYQTLPKIIAVHFNIAGDPDGWGPRWSILVLGGVCVILTAGVSWLSGKPRLFNYPVLVTEHNVQALYREGERMLVWIAAAISLGYLGLVLSYLGVGTAILGAGGFLFCIPIVIIGIVRLARVG